MTDRHYNSELGEFVDFETLADWEHRDTEQRRRIAELLDVMAKYLPILEALEASGQWDRFAAATGIATANRYRAAIAKAEGRS